MRNFAFVLLAGTVLMAIPGLATKENYPMITIEQIRCESAQALLLEAGEMVVQTKSILGYPLRFTVTSKRTCPQAIGIIQHPASFRSLDQKHCRMGWHVECEKDSAYDGTGA